MIILTLNCQKGYQTSLKSFLQKTLVEGIYDALILQEVTGNILPCLNHPAYQCIRGFSEEIGESELRIVLRNSFKLLDQGFTSFASMREHPKYGFKHPSQGILRADLEYNGGTIRIASVHTHSGISPKIRLLETMMIKESVLNNSKFPTLIGGDWNTGLPSESKRIAEILAPEFTCISGKTGPTLDSRYSENLPHITNRVAFFLSLINIGIRLRTDHVFLDTSTAKGLTATCRTLAHRVSDHSPVECILNPL